MRGLRSHGRPQSSLETSCGARMRTDVTPLAYHPGDGRLSCAVMQPVQLRLGLGGAVMTSHPRLSCGRHIRRGDARIHIHNP